MIKSKGKWIPGSLESLRKTHGCGYTFYCESCERGFSTQSSFSRHNATQLHFKRMLKSKSETETLGVKRAIGFGYDQLGDNEGLPTQRKRRKIDVRNYANSAVGKGDEGKVRCPTCYAHFHKQMMGKHLLSFFHCQKSEMEGRRVEPEKSLILENIHSIVSLSPYQCKPCCFYFSHRLQLLLHFEQSHVHGIAKEKSSNSRPTGWICSVCQSRGYDEIAMFKHLKDSPEHAKMEAAIQKSIPIVINRINLFSCNTCGKNFVLNRELLSHRATCGERISAKGGSQETCINNSHPNDLRTNDVVQRDTSVHSTQICKICQFSSKSRANFYRHLKIHDESREKSFRCNTCDMRFYEKFQLNYHMKLHRKRLIPCTYPGCDYSGRSNSEVTNHALTHAKNKHFNCGQCNYSTKVKSHLTRHFRLIHQLCDKAEKEFKCKLCDYATNLPQGLKRHDLIHLKNNLFLCPYCSYCSKSMDNIRVHVLKRKAHAGAVLYTCQICKTTETGFSSNKFNDFKQHVVRNHPENLHNTTDHYIFALAGLRKSNYLKSISSDASRENNEACANLRQDTFRKPGPDTYNKISETQAISPLISAQEKRVTSNIRNVNLEVSSVEKKSDSLTSPDLIELQCPDPYDCNYSFNCTELGQDHNLVDISVVSNNEVEADDAFCDDEFFNNLLNEEAIIS